MDIVHVINRLRKILDVLDVIMHVRCVQERSGINALLAKPQELSLVKVYCIVAPARQGTMKLILVNVVHVILIVQLAVVRIKLIA